ncbi:conserved hypothetical protein [Chloroherpeton thalassium ATCC 35110]|uniref:Delta-aminolevulinic acid dehydratase n=1 Tax=Chloroherpeton thalassium (strain ATCC 35110 / GB-78) TaxID=517418 RepID=B3QU35_CHLT3|nr:hypothetical protein [Chloroherpeton thalassium]ACF12833.1 conserved hypothetical protein [Chloroherpeton thalassium ATCC 35110]
MATSKESIEKIQNAVLQTEKYILAEQYRGYDPYDALGSPIFDLPVLQTNKILRLGAQQVLKRLPINLRPQLHIQKGYNPVTLGLCLYAYSYLAKVFPKKESDYLKHITFCINELEKFRSKGYSGACWGYDFDWEARYAKIPAYTPTIVATGFITNALFTAYNLHKIQKAVDLCISACDFLKSDLNRTEFEDGSFCWSYSPLDRQVVLNATMKGARLCAQVACETKDQTLIELAEKTVRFVVKKQRANGSWPYSIGDTRTWADNFHTGYVLDALDSYQIVSGDELVQEAKHLGWKYYRNSFFIDDQIPKYYDNQLYPIDATAVAQSILTLVRFGDVETANTVALWSIDNLMNSDGSFIYQKHKFYRNSVVYMRWSVAWMFCALSELLYFCYQKG